MEIVDGGGGRKKERKRRSEPCGDREGKNIIFLMKFFTNCCRDTSDENVLI